MDVRNRVIKADFWTDEELGELPRDVRLLFAGLWCYADDWGRLEERPQKIRVALFPYDQDVSTGEVSDWLDELVRAGKLTRYETQGQQYLFIRAFFKHQQQRRHSASKLPPPPGADGQLRPASFISEHAPTFTDEDRDSPTLSASVRVAPTLPADVPPARGDNDRDRDRDRSIPPRSVASRSGEGAKAAVPPIAPPPRPGPLPSYAPLPAAFVAALDELLPTASEHDRRTLQSFITDHGPPDLAAFRAQVTFAAGTPRYAQTAVQYALTHLPPTERRNGR